ncbi:MAG: DUF488 family protein [Betaproteobacteria bacterium]|nr:DUF488 family protein [Betaproteobacteria bacterium]
MEPVASSSASPPGTARVLATQLQIRRVYEPASPDDGFRVLIDRLWPRGLRRESAAIDLWFKDIAPSPALRTWFGHEPARWAGFGERYRAELDANAPAVQRLAGLLRAHGRMTLLYAARDPVHNHAVVLRDYLREPGPATVPGATDNDARTESGADSGGGLGTAALRERLVGEHARILALMVELRVALVRGDAEAARAMFDELAALHQEHAELERTRLFPALPRAARWPLRTYEAEHDKLEQQLQALRERLRAAPARLRSPRQRLELADATLPLQHLLEHHFEREHKGLFVEVG